MIQCIKALLDLDDTFKVIGGDVRELTKQQREIWNNKNKESPLRKHRSSPVSIIAEYEAEYTDKNSMDSISVSAHAGLADSLLECEADIQKEQDMVFLQTSLAYKSSRSCKTLPTLEERDGDDTDGENDEERTIVQKSLSSYSSTSTSCHTSPRRTNITEEEKHGVLDHLEIKLLKSTASEYAFRGNEEEAIRTYKRALHLTRIEVNRIQIELDLSRDSVTKTPNNVRRTLRREWTEVALAIAEIRPMMAILYERIGDYERAMKCCNEARDVYERQAQFDRKENVTNSIAEARMTQMNHMTSKMQDAKDSYELRKQLHEDSLEAHRQICVSPDPSTRERLYEALFDTLSAALALELESLGEHHPQVSDTMEFLSKIQQERFEIDKSLDSMSNAVSIAELSLGIIHPRTGDKYREIAKMFERAKRSEGDLDQAIRYYEKAIYAFENADGDHSLLIGSVLNDLGVLHIQRKQYDIAVQKLSDALAAYESLSTITNKGNGIKGGTYVEVCQIWRNLGECYALQKNWSSASMAFKSALGIQRDARKLSAAAAAANASFSFNDDDDSNQNSVSPALISDENIADTLKRLGKSFAAQQNYNPSMNAFLEALTLLQTVYDKEPTQEKQDQVANILYCLAEVKKSNEKYSEALRLYEESLELRMLSDRFRPEKEKTNHSHCAMCLAGIGSIRMARKEYEHAFKAYNEALICTRNQKLPEFHPMVQMLWDKSNAAAQKMGDSDSSIASSLHSRVSSKHSRVSSVHSRNQANVQILDDGIEVTENTGPATTAGRKSKSSLIYTLTKLQKKATVQKNKGDIDGAIVTTKIILELHRASQKKKGQLKCNSSKKETLVAETLVSLAHFFLLKEANKDAEAYFKEAREMYKISGMTKDDDCVQEISRQLDRLRWQEKSTHRRKL